MAWNVSAKAFIMRLPALHVKDGKVGECASSSFYIIFEGRRSARWFNQVNVSFLKPLGVKLGRSLFMQLSLATMTELAVCLSWVIDGCGMWGNSKVWLRFAIWENVNEEPVCTDSIAKTACSTADTNPSRMQFVFKGLQKSSDTERLFILVLKQTQVQKPCFSKVPTDLLISASGLHVPASVDYNLLICL